MSVEVPSLNRLLHYVSRGSKDGKFPSACRSSIVTETNGRADAYLVGLMVMNPTGLFFHSIAEGGSRHDSDGGPGSWHWHTECPYGNA